MSIVFLGISDYSEHNLETLHVPFHQKSTTEYAYHILQAKTSKAETISDSELFHRYHAHYLFLSSKPSYSPSLDSLELRKPAFY